MAVKVNPNGSSAVLIHFGVCPSAALCAEDMRPLCRLASCQGLNASRIASLSPSRRRRYLALDEREQIGVDLFGVGRAHAMREARIDLELRVLHDLRGH